MGKPVIFLLFVVALLFGQRIFIRFLAKANRRFINSDVSEGAADTASEWENDGKRRNFENAEYTLAENDFFEKEITEIKTLEEEFEGLSDEEIESIVKEAGIIKTAGGRDE